jgi:butyrate kinase
MLTKAVLTINPGSTSTKVAIFVNEKSVFVKTIRHTSTELSVFPKIVDQYEFRKKIILEELVKADVELSDIVAVVGRGGLIRPIESGIYEVNEQMKKDLLEGYLGQHASNLGGLIADDIARNLPNAKAYIADPVVVDELQDVARITGLPEVRRISIFHALNQKAIARSYVRLINKKYEDVNLIIAHLGGGTSIGAHRKGRVVDVNNALDGDGPFTPERAGTLPAGQVVKMCFSGKYTIDDMKRKITGGGGLVAHIGTNEAYEVEKMALAGDAKAQLLLDAMAYQISKFIGAMAAVLQGKVDAIILTGGVAHDRGLVEYIDKMVGFIAPVIVFAGEDEMKALAMNAFMVMKGDIEPKQYLVGE